MDNKSNLHHQLSSYTLLTNKNYFMELLITAISEQMHYLMQKVISNTASKDERINLAVLTHALKNLRY